MTRFLMQWTALACVAVSGTVILFVYGPGAWALTALALLGASIATMMEFR